MKTPLAWKNLTHDRKRLALAVGGIGFAVLLMFMQLGFRGALYDSTLALPRLFDADIVLVSPQRYTLSVRQKFPKRFLKLASSSSLVKSASPLYFENNLSNWKPMGEVVGPPIRLLAFDPTSPPLLLPDLAQLAGRLTAVDTVLFDRKSKEDFGDLEVGQNAELNGRSVTVVGHVSLGTDFADDGTVLASDRTFNSVIYGRTPMPESLDDLDFGLIRVRDGVDPEAACEELRRIIPPQALVLTKQQYLDTELTFWSTATPIGYVFALGTAMGFLVGTIICYQILFADIADHLREFATLKAMGYRPKYFIGVVLQESLILSLLGFVPGAICAALLYRMVAMLTGLLMDMSWDRTLLVAVLTMAMCIVSGCLTMNKVLQTDPAEMF